MKLRFTRRAVHDLTGIGDYLRPRNPTGAARVRAAILDSLQILTQFPAAGRLQSLQDVRKLVTRKWSYLIYYRIDNAADEVVVLTIQHPSREREFADI